MVGGRDEARGVPARELAAGSKSPGGRGARANRPATGADGSYPNDIRGRVYPGEGLRHLRTKRASLNISFYGLFRYMNQMPGNQTFTDHLGRERAVKARNDLNWHRTFVWLTGFFYDPKFRYNISLWSLPTTQQTLLFGNLQYRFSQAFGVGVGIAPNLTARSMQGSWPFWASSDRQMAEEFFRGGFSSGFFVTGQPVERFCYTASVNTNISQLGTTASNDTRDMAYSASVVWRPTTGEFGPRNGLGDFEYHTEAGDSIRRVGRPQPRSRYASDDAPPNATQIRLSDGVNPFEADALAPGVTVKKLDYDVARRRCRLQVPRLLVPERILRPQAVRLRGHGPVPPGRHRRQGLSGPRDAHGGPRKLGRLRDLGHVFDDFERNPWEVSGGANFYPTGSRSWRLNLHVIRIEKSPAASNFGYYTAGQSGTTISLGTDILL